METSTIIVHTSHYPVINEYRAISAVELLTQIHELINWFQFGINQIIFTWGHWWYIKENSGVSEANEQYRIFRDRLFHFFPQGNSVETVSENQIVHSQSGEWINITLETKSQNTRESAQNSLSLLKNKDTPVILLSNAFHLPRIDNNYASLWVRTRILISSERCMQKNFPEKTRELKRNLAMVVYNIIEPISRILEDTEKWRRIKSFCRAYRIQK